jgi:hypothetical protein
MGRILPLVLLTLQVVLQGQGNVNFANVGVGLNSPFSDCTGARLSGSLWTLELWAGPDPGGVGALLAGPAFMGTFANGFFNAGQRTVSNVTGNTAFAQIRIWDNMGGTITSFEQAMAAGVSHGASSWFTQFLSTPPATPATMVNLASATWTGVCIPEPSTITLGVMAAAGLLLRGWMRGGFNPD